MPAPPYRERGAARGSRVGSEQREAGAPTIAPTHARPAPSSADRVPGASPPVRFAELLGVASLAVAQPALSVLGANAQFFVIRHASVLQTTVLVAWLVLMPPLVAFGIELLARLVSVQAQSLAHVALCSAFAGLIAAQVAASRDPPHDHTPRPAGPRSGGPGRVRLPAPPDVPTVPSSARAESRVVRRGVRVRVARRFRRHAASDAAAGTDRIRDAAPDRRRRHGRVPRGVAARRHRSRRRRSSSRTSPPWPTTRRGTGTRRPWPGSPRTPFPRS